MYFEMKGQRTMTWDAFHRRGDVLRNVMTEADRRRDGILPTDVPGVRETFRDELDLVATLQLRWHTRLAGRIEGALSEQPMDLEDVVVRSWRETAASMPGVREILDHHRAHPTSAEMAHAMEVAETKEHQMLAVLAGQVSSVHADRFGRERGAALEAAARAGRTPVGSPRAESVLDRIKAAIAA